MPWNVSIFKIILILKFLLKIRETQRNVFVLLKYQLNIKNSLWIKIHRAIQNMMALYFLVKSWEVVLFHRQNIGIKYFCYYEKTVFFDEAHTWIRYWYHFGYGQKIKCA